MKEKDLYQSLAKKFKEPIPEKLSEKIGLSGIALRNWKDSSKMVRASQIANLVAKTQEYAIHSHNKNLIRPIVEFFPMETAKSKQGVKWELFDPKDFKKSRLANLRTELMNASGVYIFYDSRGRALYVGKAQIRSLWDEMKSALNRDRKDLQQIKLVAHPTINKKFVPAYETLRRIKPTRLVLADMAAYFSAYAVDKSFIGDVEALLVRISANDMLNKRMEKFPHLMEE